MRLKFAIVLGLIFGTIFLVGCYDGIPQNAKQTLYVKFVNSEGDDLIVKNGITIDTIKGSGSSVGYFIRESEYSLSLKINDVAFIPDLPLSYSTYSDWSRGFVEFGCWDNNSNLKNQRDPYTYEYSFVCPRLFGDDQPHTVSVVWDTRKKTIYNRTTEIRFDGELIEHNDVRDPRVIIILN